MKYRVYSGLFGWAQWSIKVEAGGRRVSVSSVQLEKGNWPLLALKVEKGHKPEEVGSLEEARKLILL